MKKKLHNGFLLVAMLLATVGSYVSCKDYDEEAYANMLGENSKLEELVNAQVAALEEKINLLENATCECECNLETLNKHLEEWQKFMGQGDDSTPKTTITEIVADIAAIESEIADLENQKGRIYTAIQNANDALESNLMDSILKVQSDLTTLINIKLDDLVKNNITPLQNAIENLNTIIDSKADASEIARLEGLIKDLNERIEGTNGLQDQIDSLESRVSTLEYNYKSIANDVEAAYNLAKSDSTRIDALQKAFDELKECNCDNTELLAKIDSICDELSAVKDSANVALALARENLEKANAYTDERIDYVLGELGKTNVTLAELEKAYKDADEALQDQIDDLSKALEAATKRIEENEKKIDELTGKVNKIDESLKQFITGIILQRVENPVFGSYSFPANIQTNILMAYYGYAGSYGGKDLEFPSYYPRYYVRESETLSQMDIKMLGVEPALLAGEGEALVSGAGKVYVTVNPSNVNFEGQILPIVNSLDEESGIKLDSLKYSDKKLTFGATRAAVNGFYEAEAILDAKNIDKVKMTFDFNASDIKETVKDIINPLDGINVTQVANTMYDVMSQFNQQLDANALKASWTDSMGVTRNIYSQYNLAATAIKPLSYAFMKDVNFTSFPGFDKMRNVAGKLLDKMANKFKVALDGIPEFNFDTERIEKINFNDINFDFENSKVELTITYIDTLEKEINISDYINIDIYKDVVIKDTTIIVNVNGPVEDNEGNVIGSVKYDQPITIPGDTIRVHIEDNIPFTWSEVVEIPINAELTLDNKELQELFDEAGLGKIDDLMNDTEDKVNQIIDKVNSYLDQLGNLTEFADNLANIGNKIDSEKDKIKDKIISYLDKIEDKLLTAVNSINKAVQPMMLVNTTSGFQKLSQTIYGPTVMSAANVQFIPTSYTAEVIAPAYKKLVGVTNVWSMDRSKNAQAGDADCLAALNEANAKDGVAEILDGDTQFLNFSAKKGYIYEVTYTSVDFSGMAAAKKYYVTVK